MHASGVGLLLECQEVEGARQDVRLDDIICGVYEVGSIDIILVGEGLAELVLVQGQQQRVALLSSIKLF